jgi:isopenicillin-N N-acyltransferase like protein
MKRRDFLCLAASGLAGCAYLRVDPWSAYIRSDIIDSPEREKEILSKARLRWTEDGRIRVLHTQGTPYEIGYQHGVLLRQEIHDNIGWMYEASVDKFHFEELFDEAYERQRPYIPAEYVEEMHGLAHGSKLPLKVIHGIHALPEMTEWGGKKRVKKVLKQMMEGEVVGSTCSNLSATSSATADGKPYVVRILDWGLHKISRLHQFPLIHVCRPSYGVPFANIGWIGFIGAISGMNAEGITLGEMGYGDPEGESMRGKPMPFLLRDILAHAKNLKDVRRLISTSEPTNSFVYLMSDGKTAEAEMYVRDRSRFLAFQPGTEVTDKESTFPAIPNMVYGGHYREKMIASLQSEAGKITPELLMKKIIPEVAMPSNFQNVIYSASELKFWVNNAKSKKERAAEQPYTFFDFGAALRG